MKPGVALCIVLILEVDCFHVLNRRYSEVFISPHPIMLSMLACCVILPDRTGVVVNPKCSVAEHCSVSDFDPRLWLKRPEGPITASSTGSNRDVNRSC